MNRRNDPGLWQWLMTTLIIIGGVGLIYQLIQFSNVRAYMPSGMEIANIDVGGYDDEGVRQRLTERYLDAPVVVYHGEQRIELDPRRDAGFQLDFETMVSQANFHRDRQDYWSGFWGYMWGLPIELEMVELRATHNREVLRNSLELIASELDQPAQPPQPVPATLSFLYGEIGRQTDISASISAVEAALYRPANREAVLIVEPVEPPRPNINLLANLIVNHLENFPGIASVFIVDLQNGDEISINADLPMSGMSIMKVPIVLETMRILDVTPNIEQTKLISDTLLDSGNFSANLLLDVIAGQDNAFLGADMMTGSLQQLGLVNTFMVTPYEEEPRQRVQTLETPANVRPGINTSPDPAMQTTAEEIGALLAMIYYCAKDGGGALIAAYNGQISMEECQFIIDTMGQNFIGSLIEEGTPADAFVAHKHGWISHTHGDAGIVYTNNGNYVIVMYLHEDEWLDWAISSPMMADLARATYNYFNFDTPYLGR